MAGETAQAYFSLLALDMQLDTARRTLKTREDAFSIYSSRYKQGDITELDWQRARAEVETARAQVHTSTVAVDKAEAALAVLLGRSPRDIMERAMVRGQAISMLPAPPALPAGLPSDLLERRPDIRAAEFLIMANNANIGVARAQFFPSISLTGMLGTVSSSVGSLFSGPAGVWSYGVSGNVPLLDFGNNWYNLKDAEAKKRAAIAEYRKAVQNAFADIRTSLTAQREADAIVRSMQIQVESLRRSTQIARLQYDNGYTDYLTVLDAERQLFAAELQLAGALRDRLDSVVGVCMALGGGWQDSSKLYLRCEGCGNTAVMDMDATVNGIVRQFREHEQHSCTAYTPSAEVMRLDNAINRGLEQPDSPEAVMALILQGAAARYACCPAPSAESEPSDSLTEADWRRFQRAVSHITISQDTEVTLIFTDKKATGKDE